MEQTQGIISKLATRRNIVTVIVVILVAEIAWGVWTLTKPTKQGSTERGLVSEAKASSASVFLQTPKSSYTIGEKVVVTISISSTRHTDGTDLIIKYDPKVLAMDPAVTKAPVAVGKIYTEYPINTVDEKAGKITVSGITSAPSGVVPQGVFGTVTFVAKASGKTKIALDFTPGSTSDSNVVESKTALDVLDGVKDVDLTIVP